MAHYRVCATDSAAEHVVVAQFVGGADEYE